MSIREMTSDLRQYLQGKGWAICDEGNAYLIIPGGPSYRYRFAGCDVTFERQGIATGDWRVARRWPVAEVHDELQARAA